MTVVLKARLVGRGTSSPSAARSEKRPAPTLYPPVLDRLVHPPHDFPRHTTSTILHSHHVRRYALLFDVMPLPSLFALPVLFTVSILPSLKFPPKLILIVPFLFLCLPQSPNLFPPPYTQLNSLLISRCLVIPSSPWNHALYDSLQQNLRNAHPLSTPDSLISLSTRSPRSLQTVSRLAS